MANKKVETHAKICQSMTDLYERKNHDYGDSFAKIREVADMLLTELNFILPSLFDDLL